MLATIVVAIVGTYFSSPNTGRTVKKLVIWVLIFSATGALLSLMATIAWMIWYEKTTGFSAGNAPIGWIFVYGPASFAVGELVGLGFWLCRKRHVVVP